MKTQANSNPILSFREKQALKSNAKLSTVNCKKQESVLNDHGTMITETREQIDTSEISG